MNTLVSIVCNTYNHENYIAESLDSFIKQITNFSFEILIHDDASTDNTAFIIKDYQSKFPLLIKPILQIENQASKGLNNWIEYQFPRALGKYIAICDGDDYWTDPYKLQKQVDFLEQFADFTLVGHQTLKLENGCYTKFKNSKTGIVTLADALSGFVTHTSSLFFRKSILSNISTQFKDFRAGDAAIVCNALSKGYGFILNDEMSVYRINNTSIYSSLDVFNKKKWDLQTEISKLRYYPLNYFNQFTQIAIKLSKLSFSEYFNILFGRFFNKIEKLYLIAVSFLFLPLMIFKKVFFVK